MKRKLRGTLTVRELVAELSKYDPEAIVMMCTNEDEENVVDVDTDVVPAYRSSEGEVFMDTNMEPDEKASDFDKVVVLFPLE